MPSTSPVGRSVPKSSGLIDRTLGGRGLRHRVARHGRRWDRRGRRRGGRGGRRQRRGLEGDLARLASAGVGGGVHHCAGRDEPDGTHRSTQRLRSWERGGETYRIDRTGDAVLRAEPTTIVDPHRQRRHHDQRSEQGDRHVERDDQAEVTQQRQRRSDQHGEAADRGDRGGEECSTRAARRGVRGVARGDRPRWRSSR